jgi:CDP-2,3-bis-(O-geranylgeranyl)-sn-glycerol synthase
MINDLLTAIWFLLPAAAANAAPVFAAKIPALHRFDTPIDGGRKFDGQDWFGPHKTWRGFISGIIVATVVLYAQQLLVVHAGLMSFITIEYAALPVLLLGPAFAVGALGGDLIESFAKRRVGISSGKSWFFFDQIDYVIGAIVVSLFFVVLPVSQYLLMLVFWFIVHLVVSYIGYRVGLKDEPI